MARSQRQQLLRELRVASRHADWPRIHQLRAVLDEIPLGDELAVACAALGRPDAHYSMLASQWVVRLLVERNPGGGLASIERVAKLLQCLDRPAARMELAGWLYERASIDARKVLGVPIPPKQERHEHLLDYLDRLRSLGALDAFSAFERAKAATWRIDP